MGKILLRSKIYFNKLRSVGLGYELIGSLFGTGASFILYHYLNANFLWQLALVQSKYILIASILSLKMESWEQPGALSPGKILSLGIVFLPMILVGIVRLDVYILSLLFALLSNLHVYSISKKMVFIPTIKGCLVPMALILTIITNEKLLVKNLIVAHIFVLAGSIRSAFWQDFKLLSRKDLVRAWSLKELILGGILLKYVNVAFYDYLGSLILPKVYFYMERLIRLFWGIVGVRLRTSMIAGHVYKSYIYSITLVSGVLALTKFSFVGFYLSRYLLQVQTYSGKIRKYSLLQYVISVMSLIFIFQYLELEKSIFNVVSAGVLVVFIIGWRERK